jgi:hypothetical protein
VKKLSGVLGLVALSVHGVAMAATDLGAPNQALSPSPVTDCSLVQGIQFGADLAAGDLDGDGLDDILAAPGWVAYSGPGGNLSDPVKLKNRGNAVAIGDFNHDHIKDAALLGSPGNLVVVFYGHSTRLTSTTTPDWTRDVLSNGLPHGLAVADPNADGIDDLVVGAVGSGHAYVFYGSATGLRDPATHPPDFDIQDGTVSQLEGSATFSYQITDIGAVAAQAGVHCSGSQCGAQFAFGAPSTSIDVNHDGVFDSNTEGNMGAVVIAPNSQYLSGEKRAFSNFGVAAGTAGDVNHDGATDFMASALAVSAVPAKVFLYLGQGTSGHLDLVSPWVVAGSAPFTGAFGAQVGSLGDLNKDGFGDIFISDTEFDTVGGRDPTTALGFWGRVLIWKGGASSASDPTGLGPATATSADFQISGTSASGYGFGNAVVTANLDNDGKPDVVVGDPRRYTTCFASGKQSAAEIGGILVYRSRFAPPANPAPIAPWASVALAALLLGAGLLVIARTRRFAGR